MLPEQERDEFAVHNCEMRVLFEKPENLRDFMKPVFSFKNDKIRTLSTLTIRVLLGSTKEYNVYLVHL